MRKGFYGVGGERGEIMEMVVIDFEEGVAIKLIAAIIGVCIARILAYIVFD